MTVGPGEAYEIDRALCSYLLLSFCLPLLLSWMNILDPEAMLYWDRLRCVSILAMTEILRIVLAALVPCLACVLCGPLFCYSPLALRIRFDLDLLFHLTFFLSSSTMSLNSYLAFRLPFELDFFCSLHESELDG